MKLTAFHFTPGPDLYGVNPAGTLPFYPAFYHVLSGLNAFMAFAIFDVFGPRSLSYTTPWK